MTPPSLEGERISIGRSRFTIPHRPLATRFGLDSGVSILSFRSLAVWMLGYPEAGLADADRALKDAREIGQAATLMYARRIQFRRQQRDFAGNASGLWLVHRRLRYARLEGRQGGHCRTWPRIEARPQSTQISSQAEDYFMKDCQKEIGAGRRARRQPTPRNSISEL
jgi:hypothetical protein